MSTRKLIVNPVHVSFFYLTKGGQINMTAIKLHTCKESVQYSEPTPARVNTPKIIH